MGAASRIKPRRIEERTDTGKTRIIAYKEAQVYQRLWRANARLTRLPDKWSTSRVLVRLSDYTSAGQSVRLGGSACLSKIVGWGTRSAQTAASEPQAKCRGIPNESVSGFGHWLPKTTISCDAAHGK